MHTVTALRVSPVKALATVLRERVLLEAHGVAEDRRLFLLRPDGSLVTQRQSPQLTRVVPHLDLSRGAVTVTCPDGVTATTELSDVGQQTEATLFGKERSGRLVPGPVDDLLSELVQEPLRLVLADRTGVGWDEGPVSLIGGASVDAVGPPGSRSETAARFRMLVEIDGGAPYEEETWIGERVRLGSAVVRVTHRLERCVIINHSPVTGTQDWPGLKTLAALRGPDRIALGVIATVDRPGEIRVGDAAEVLSGATNARAISTPDDS